jgi:hypothetical protein
MTGIALSADVSLPLDATRRTLPRRAASFAAHDLHEIEHFIEAMREIA